MCDLRAKFIYVELHLQQSKPDFLFLSKKKVSIPLQKLTIQGYLPIITKQDHLNRHGDGLGAYIKCGFPCGRDTKAEDTDHLCVCFHIAFICSTTFLFVLNRSQNDMQVLIDRISDRFHNIFTEFPSVSVHICGEFNIQNKDWLVHSNKTDEEGRYCRF